MPVKIKIKPVRRQIDLAVSKYLSPKARQEMIAKYARGIIADADAQNARVLGKSPPKTVTVDGREGASLESVNPDNGRIIAEWQLVNEVLSWIADTLAQRSPIVSGDYRDAHIMLADDAKADPYNPPMATEFTFLNLVPYSRRLEIGRTESGRDFLISVPNKIYVRTADDAKAKFGNIAKIRSGFVTPTEAYLLKNDRASRSFTGGIKRISARQRADRVAGSAVTVPAIMVTLRG